MFFSAFRQRLIHARMEARRAIAGVEEINVDAHKGAKRANLVLVEVNHGVATLRSLTDLQPKVTLRMSVPYRKDCAYTFANGKLYQLGFKNTCASRLSLTQESYVIIMNNFTRYIILYL